MSIKYVLAALEAQIGSAAAKLVLISLADNADNETGKCWPSIKSICQRAELSDRAVRDNIQKLEGMGLLTVTRRMHEGVNLPNIYVLHIEKLISLNHSKASNRDNERASGVVNLLQGGGEPPSGGVVNLLPTNLSLEPVIEPSISSLHSEIPISHVKPEKTKTAEDPVIDSAFNLYNEYAELASWPKATKLTVPRRSSMKARIADAGGLDGWKAAMERAVKSPLLTGQNERGWRADLDFFLQAKSFTKLLEGSYDSRKPAGKSDIMSPAAAQSAVKAYWATFGIDRAIEADPGRKEDWKDLLTVWFEHEIWPNKYPNPKHPQCAIPKAMVQAFADKYGWEAPRYRKVETVAA